MRPIAIDKLKKVKEVSCGDEHTLILSSEGNLYATGSNNQG